VAGEAQDNALLGALPDVPSVRAGCRTWSPWRVVKREYDRLLPGKMTE